MCWTLLPISSAVTTASSATGMSLVPAETTTITPLPCFWRFALGENHFGHALAQGAMVVELGESQVFEGEMTEALDSFVGGESLFSDLLEQLAQGLGVHRRRSHCRLP